LRFLKAADVLMVVCLKDLFSIWLRFFDSSRARPTHYWIQLHKLEHSGELNSFFQ